MNEPTEISDERAAQIIGCYSRRQETQDKSDYGLYYMKEPNGTIVAIDNSTGHCWIEEFNSLPEARRWLMAG